MTMSDSNAGGSPAVALILHERRGNWARNLRTRLVDAPIRWFESRSTTQLLDAARGLTAPVALIDLGDEPYGPLEDLTRLVEIAPSARVLVLDPQQRPEVAESARALGATHLISGFVPPPEVAALLARWIRIAAEETARQGWSRPLPADPSRQPLAWIDEVIEEARRAWPPT